jgi:hypothetical protein
MNTQSRNTAPSTGLRTIPISHPSGRTTSSLISALGLLVLAGCAGFGPSASLGSDGVYQLIATPIQPSSSDIGCAPFAQDVVVDGRRVDLATHGTTLRGTIDAEGEFHGEITPRGPSLALASAIDIPGVGVGSSNQCQWHYRFQYEGTAQEVPGAD